MRIYTVYVFWVGQRPFKASSFHLGASYTFNHHIKVLELHLIIVCLFFTKQNCQKQS